MKKFICILLTAALVLCLGGCGKSEAVKGVETAIAGLGEITADSLQSIEIAEAAYAALSQEDKADVENYALLLEARAAYEKAVEEAFLAKVLGQWKNVNDGDTYTLEADGKGTHDDVTISYTVDVEKGSVSIVEGVSSIVAKTFLLDTAAAYPRLIPEGENCYYVPAENYEEVSLLVQAETIKLLTSCEFWKSTRAVNYISFTETGGGWFLLTGYTSGLSWTFVDNNTVKVSVDYNGGYSIVLDAVNDNGSLKLLNAGDGTVAYIPKQ